MIPIETCYETYDGELLAIVEAFKTWRHYLEGYKYKILVLTNHNNLCQFMDTKSLSSKQVRWTQELSRYQFRIDYRQGKANGAADTLSQYPQRSAEEENTLRAKNVKILHCLQFLLVRVSGLLVDLSQISPLYQVLICGTTVLPQLCQFLDSLQRDIARDNPYIANIKGMRLCLSKLQENNKEAKLLGGALGLPEGWEDVEGVLQYQGLPYVPEIICSKVINCYYDDPLIGHFGIDKTRELVGRKYYWPETLKAMFEDVTFA